MIKTAINQALAMHEGGAAGYMLRLSLDRPELFVNLLKRMLPVSVKAELEPGTLLEKMIRAAQAQKAIAQQQRSNGQIVDLKAEPAT